MRPTTTLTIAALVVATIATGAAAPALAQDQGRGKDHGRELHQRGPGGDRELRHERDGGPRMMMRMGQRGGAGGLFALVCSETGGDRLEHMLLNVAQRTDLTAAQQPLYDAFKAAAMTAQTDFAAACTTARPASAEATATPDFADRLKARLAIEKAHVDAMTAVLPAFEAFYDSLTDEQKQALEPRMRRDRETSEHRLDERGKPRGPQSDAPQNG